MGRLLPRRLRAPLIPGEALRIERVIAIARLLMTVIALFQIDLDPIQPASYAPIARMLFVAFSAHSVSALLVLHLRQRTSRGFMLTTHTVDLLAAAVTLPMAAPGNPFFIFFLFVLATAAFRWGFRETVATTAAAIGLVLVHLKLAAVFPGFSLGAKYDFDRVIVRGAYLAMMGLFLGSVAEEGRLLRAEAAAVATLLAKIRVNAGATRALTATAHDLVRIFNASRLMLIVHDQTTQRAFRWDSAMGWSVAPVVLPADPKGGEPPPNYNFLDQRHSFAIFRWWFRKRPSAFQISAVDEEGRSVDSTAVVVPSSFEKAYSFRRLISVPVTFGAEWSGRIFIFDPKIDVHLISLTRFLQTIVRQIGPALLSVYLLERLRMRAGAMERARVARELHDGVIQSLIGAEMQLEVLRSSQLRGTPAAGELMRLQSILKTEVLNLRELMQQMRPPDVDPDELLDYIADMVQRFGRDTGITARFVTDLQQVALPRHVCFELVRIVQEGLVNVRKHSAAANVTVRFGMKTGFWTLEIDDDGKGFPFEGRLSQEDLDERRSGPDIIKERVRSIGGQLAIDSAPGRGARLEVLVPQEGR